MTFPSIRRLSSSALVFAAGVVLLAGEGDSGPGLATASLEELMNVEISSVSRKQQKLSQTAAAVFVITQEDILRSGATSLPEVLRLAPGLQVARIDSGKWAVSARGFNGRFANKILVLIDGRSIYTQVYSGTYWDQNDLLLEDVERIEVVRGPGATTWGANAVNGVINIITKKARASQGGFVTGSGGPFDDGYFGARYGGTIGRRGSYRAFTKLAQAGTMTHQFPVDEMRAHRTQRGGGRIEWELSGRDSLMLQGDLYHGGMQQDLSDSIASLGVRRPRADPVEFSGGFLQAEWRRKQERLETTVRWFMNREDRREGAGNLHSTTHDFDLQQRYAANGRNDVIWGAGFRINDAGVEVNPRANVYIDPGSLRTKLWSTYAQDEITLVRNRLVLSVGSKFLHQEISGFAMQPGARLLWTPTARRSVWASATRAVRTPSRRDQDIAYEFPLPASLAPEGVFGRYQGTRSFRPENVVAVEAGYRQQLGERLTVDVALFRSAYGSLESLRPGTVEIRWQPEFRVTVPFLLGNEESARTMGAEIATQWRPAHALRISTNYSFLNVRHLAAPGAPVLPGFGSPRDPRHQVQCHVAWDLARRWTFDGFAYAVTGIAGGRVPGYLRTDVRLARRFGEHGEVSIGGRNLLDSRHLEFLPEDFVLAQEVRRSAYVRFTWKF